MSQQEIYLGNPNLKRANVAQNFTPEEVEEFVKCSKDPVYFITNYTKIISLDPVSYTHLTLPTNREV